MLQFLFKPKPIVLDCFTIDPFAYEYAKIAPATENYPEWWKSIPPTYPSRKKYLNGETHYNPTIKSCRGLTSLYKESFVIPMWAHLEMEIQQEEFRWGLNTDVDYFDRQWITSHPPQQYNGWVDNDKYMHVKILSPWWVRTKSDTNFAFVDPVWNRSNINSYTVLPGLMDFKYQNTTNVNIMIEKRDEYHRVDIKPGDPLVQIIPLTEHKVTLKHHLVTKDEITRYAPDLRLNTHLLPKLYSYKKKMVSDHEARKKGKCPFGFDK